jgi:hypothetical protein
MIIIKMNNILLFILSSLIEFKDKLTYAAIGCELPNLYPEALAYV